MKKYLFPPLVLAVFGAVTWVLITMKPEPERQEGRPKEPVVEFIVAKRTTQRTFVDAFGTVRPRTSTTLVAEAPGLIEAVAPFPNEDTNRSGPPASFRPGGFFEKGDLLVSIEDIDHRAAKADAEALLRTAELQLVQERALAEQARAEWELDRDWATAPDLVKRLPQIRKAEAEAAAAEAPNQAQQALGQAEQKMADAKQQLQENNPQEARPPQGDALDELQKAKQAIDNEINQLAKVKAITGIQMSKLVK